MLSATYFGQHPDFALELEIAERGACDRCFFAPGKPSRNMSACRSVGNSKSDVDYNGYLHIRAVEPPHFVQSKLGNIVGAWGIDIQETRYTLCS